MGGSKRVHWNARNSEKRTRKFPLPSSLERGICFLSQRKFTSSRDLYTSLNSEIPTSDHSGTRHYYWDNDVGPRF